MISKLTIETSERRHRSRSIFSVVNFEHISHDFVEVKLGFSSTYSAC